MNNMETEDDITEEQRSKEIERQYVDYLDDAEDQSLNTDAVKQMIEENKRRLIVNINHLRNKFPERAAVLLENSFEELIPFQRALKSFVANIDTDYSKQGDFFVGFEGSFGSKHTTPRTLTSSFLGNMVCVEGIVTRCSLVRPKVTKSVHYCDTTKTHHERVYSDLTSFEAFPASAVYPKTDDDGNPLETEYGLSTYKDHQVLSMQEMPEKAPAGQLPRSVDIICDNDLVDACKPGDRVQVVGSYRCLPGKQGGYTSGSFRTILIANNIRHLDEDKEISVSREDVYKCKKLAKNNPCKDIFKLLSKSLAPSIHGHEYVKKALLCLLLGGNEKILPNGTRLRGDINVLLIGDPSVAKSQLLRYVLSIAPRAITTTGRGSSGVGLTAAVTSDTDTGERRLEAGAMVLADRGVICIDEFDKMSDIDRTAIHEVMEQGRVTIAKAGIHASLNARCSVLAAANPVYGRYDQYKTPMENIGLQDSLLSRFDLLFVLLDTVNPDVDHIIGDHVVRMHRYRKPNEKEGEVLPFNTGLDILSTRNLDEEEEDENVPIYEKYDPLLHGRTRLKTDQILTAKFMKKYIHIARIIKPKLSEEAAEEIADEYSRLRSEDMLESDVARTQPVTARTLETLIRLSTAHAKARLSDSVKKQDVDAAIELVQFAYFKRVLEKERKRRRRNSGAESDNEDNSDQGKTKRKRKTTEGDDDADDPFAFVDDEEEENVTIRPSRSRRQESQTEVEQPELAASEPMEAEESTAPQEEISKERLLEFGKRLAKMFTETRGSGELSLKKVNENISLGLQTPFSQGEIKSALNKMTEENKIMVSEDQIFQI